MQRSAIVSTFLLLLMSVKVSAETPMEVLPARVGVALSVRNLEELQKKGDEFLKELKGVNVSIRPSQILTMAYAILNLQGVVDEKRPTAIILASPRLILNKEIGGLNDFEKLLVGMIPFKDYAAIAKRFGVTKEMLKDRKVIAAQPQNQVNNFGKFIAVRGKHLYFGNHQPAVQSLVEGKRLGEVLSKDRREDFNRADIMVHFGAQEWGNDWKGSLDSLQRDLADKLQGTDKATFTQLVDALKSIEYGLAGLYLNKGAGLSFLTTFHDNIPKETKKLLASLSTGSESSTLQGLPAKHAIVAQSIRAEGAQTSTIARVMFHFLLDYYVDTDKILSALERPNYTGVFGQLWKHLKGNRLGLYRTADEQELGLFSLVGILETEKPSELIKEMQTLSRMAIGTALDLKNEKKKKATEAQIHQLINDLGARRYTQRESATLKLSLIGEPVLPYLAKAIKQSKDLEVIRRATEIQDRLIHVVKARREELLQQKIIVPLRPQFIFVKDGEKRGEYKVDIVRVKLTNEDKLLTTQFEKLLGPDWNRIRLVTIDKQIIVLFGSDVNLLDETLKNLKGNKPGLAAIKDLQRFKKYSDRGHNAEIHVSMQRFLNLLSAEDLKQRANAKAGEAFSSFSLTISEKRMRFDIWMPMAELNSVVSNKRWW